MGCTGDKRPEPDLVPTILKTSLLCTMDYLTAFRLWNAPPPLFLDDVLVIPADQELLVNGERVSLPWPFLKPEQLADAFSILDDWGIPRHLVPIAGDFHDLLCIDVESARNEIVILDDSRNEVTRFSNYEDFLMALRAID